MASLRRLLRPFRPSATKKADKLLQGYLTPEQTADWLDNRAINVRGSNGQLYRVFSGGFGGVVDAYGTLCNVWAQRLSLAADKVLALKLYLESNADDVWMAGCHCGTNQTRPHDYGGKI